MTGIMDDRAPMLFSPESSGTFAADVAAALRVDLAPLEARVFEDGEHKTRPLASVRGRDVYVLQSLFTDSGHSVNDRLVQLLFFIATVRDAGASRVTAVTPYMGYARKDRRTKPRDPVTTRYVAQLFEAVGTDCVVTLDVHNLAAFENAFRCRTAHLEAAPRFVADLAPGLADLPVTVVSPDAGGIKRAEAFRQRLEAALGRPVGSGFAEKHRSSGIVSGAGFVGPVEGRIAIVVDDLIAGGTTVARAARACRDRGAARVIAVASHGVFAPTAPDLLAGPDVDQILITDSLPAPPMPAGPFAAKLRRLSVAPLIAEAIARLNAGGSGRLD
jgi:ribose-phosphate pyrophosphokinase